jgi:hypothetical protein
LVPLKRPPTISVIDRQQRTEYASINTIIKKKYKVLLTRQAITYFSTILLTIEREKNGDFTADITFSSDSGTTIKDITSIREDELADVIGEFLCRRFRIRGVSTFAMDISISKEQKRYEYGSFTADITFSSDSGTTIKDITSIREDELADVVKKYRIFVECIKKEEQKELSSAKKNLMYRIFSRSNIHHIAKTMNANSMKKAMVTNGVYMKNAVLSTAKINKVISELNNLKNSSINRDIYTKMSVGEISVITRSTIELDADIVSIIQKEPEVENLILKKFILDIHMSNISLSTFYSLNKINEIFHNCGMIIGFSRIATTPFSIYGAYVAAVTVNPIPILLEAIPTGLFILLPRIARFIIRRKLGKVIAARK